VGEAGHRVKGRESEATCVDVLAIEGRDALHGVLGAACSVNSVREGEDIVAMKVKRIAADERGKGFAGAVLEDACPLPTTEEGRGNGHTFVKVGEFYDVVDDEILWDIEVGDAATPVWRPQWKAGDGVGEGIAKGRGRAVIHGLRPGVGELKLGVVREPLDEAGLQ